MAILGRQRSFGVVHQTIVVTLLATAPLAAQPSTVVEDDVKAAFLYNFAKYVEWPDSAFPEGALRVCVVADAAFAKKVDDIIAGETIEGRPVTREAPSTPDEARSCNILFVGGAAVPVQKSVAVPQPAAGQTTRALPRPIRGSPPTTRGCRECRVRSA